MLRITPQVQIEDTTATGSSSTTGALKVTGGIYAGGGIRSGTAVYNAVWNDLSDRIPVDEECNLEYGRCYCFDGSHYYKSQEYCPEGLIGIHSDTAGFEMGAKPNTKELQCSVAGFVLAYVDKEYLVGTPLTAGPDGCLTEIQMEDKIHYPERIVATYWKNEPAEEWGSDDRKVKVNGRKWVKIK